MVRKSKSAYHIRILGPQNHKYLKQISNSGAWDEFKYITNTSKSYVRNSILEKNWKSMFVLKSL